MVTMIVAAVVALALPEDFDASMNMRFKDSDDGRIHISRESAYFASELVENGTSEDIDLAVKVLDAVIACQETDEGNPRHGNFWWYLEDKRVTDRNAAAFILASLIPMMIEYADRLPEPTQMKVREAIRLGLEETARIDVRVSYTNIAVKDISNTLLGGELLNEPKFTERGRKKLIEWMALTDANGIPVEFNSPTYYRVTIRALRSLVHLVKDDDTRIQAKTALARLGLSKALHIHPATGRMSGPHSRAYHSTVVGEDRPEVNHVLGWIEDNTFPLWLRDALEHQPPVMEIKETALREYNLTITTLHSPSFGLGVSTGGFSGQSNVLLSHYTRPGEDRPGVIYTRYLTNEKWLGSFYHRTDRSTSRNLSDEGSLLGAQDGARAIGLYTPRKPRGGWRRAPESITSAKGNVIWTGRELVDEIWVGQRKVDSLPIDLTVGETVVVVSGDAMSAVRPLSRTTLSSNAPLRLVDKDGDLVLEMYNYVGDSTTVTELDSLNAGSLQCGFYLEMAERSAYTDGAAFAKVVASGKITEKNERVTSGEGKTQPVWHVAYSRNGKTIGIEIETEEWTPKRRWTESGDMGFPMLESSVARQNRDGRVEVGDAVFTCGKDAGWLFAPPGTGRYVAAYHGQTAAPATLIVPGGKIEVESMGVGMIVWDNGKVTVEAVDIKGKPKVVGGQMVE